MLTSRAEREAIMQAEQSAYFNPLCLALLEQELDAALNIAHAAAQAVSREDQNRLSVCARAFGHVQIYAAQAVEAIYRHCGDLSRFQFQSDKDRARALFLRAQDALFPGGVH